MPDNPPALTASEVQFIATQAYAPRRHHRPMQFWGPRDILTFDNLNYIPHENRMPFPLPNNHAIPTAPEAHFLSTMLDRRPHLIDNLGSLETHVSDHEAAVRSHVGMLSAMNERIRLLEDQVRSLVQRLGTETSAAVDRIAALAPRQPMQVVDGTVDGVPVGPGDRIQLVMPPAPAQPTIVVTPAPVPTAGSVPVVPAVVAVVRPDAAAVVPGTSGPATPGTPSTGAPTRDTVRAALTVFSQRFGMERARRLIVTTGGVNVLSAVPVARYQAMLDAIRDESTVNATPIESR